MEDESAVRQRPDAPITKIGKVRSKKQPACGSVEALKKCTELISNAIIDMLSDEKQFSRHVYQEKTSGTVSEIELETRNVKHLRDVIQAVRELTDIARSLHGLLSPEAESELNVQIRKLAIEEKKLKPDEKTDSQTGVVILPEPENIHA